MAFQTNVFRGGEWVTETVDVHAVLKASAPKPLKKQRLLKPPECGVLTRTVVESQLVNSILPVRLRSSHHNDVAFVGDHAVQIRELRRDGQLQDVLRKSDFGSRIRNAAVLGTLPDAKKDEAETGLDSLVKTEDDDMLIERDSSPPRIASRNAPLPPQLLLLVLECGDSVFLSIQAREDGGLEFATSRFESPEEHLVYPGFHLAVDPSSRYMALGCAQHHFVVYELESIKTLNEQSRRNEPLQPVKSVRLRSVQGVIHKIEFLYPRPEDEHHIILLLIIARSGKSRMITYEWELGDDLGTVFAEEKNGHRMPVENQMPLLLIPLTVRSAFIAISPRQVAVCTGTLHGPPNFERFEILEAPATANYHGREKPLWTAWARPSRLSDYFKIRDCIYLAREDGVVNFIEADKESTLTGSTFMDKFDCNISRAFTCLYDQYSDVLVMAGDSGPGAVWKIPARQPLEQLSTLPNSCPVVDFVTTDEYSTWNDVPSSGSARDSRQLAKPDRIFATSGRGQKGSVTEYRYGLQAKIGLDLEYSIGVKQAWVFRARFSNDLGYHMLLSMPDRTGILHLSDDLSQATEPEPGSIQYDISSRTLAASASEELIIQVTENSIVLLNNQSQSSRFSYEMLQDFPSLSVADAALLGDCIAISTHNDRQFRLSVLQILNDGSPTVIPACSFPVDGEVTCLSLCRSLEDGTIGVLAGVWQAGRPWLAHAQIGVPGNSGLEMLDLAATTTFPDGRAENSTTWMEPIASIASYEHDGGQIVMLGTRSGEVINLTNLGHPRPAPAHRFGVATADITVANEPGQHATVLVSCDSNLVLLSSYRPASSEGVAGTFKAMTQVWPVDVSNPTAPSPSVDSVTVLPRNLFSGQEGTTPLLILSGSRVLLADLQLQPGPVHRQIPVEGTPLRIIYSHHLQCLIVAVNKGDWPTLMFLDPDTGEDVGVPTDKNGTPLPSIPGLGKQGDRIFGLAEWEYTKDGNVWRFLLVSTREGRLMVISTEQEGQSVDGGRPKIRYWVRFKKPSFERPIYSVLGCNEGIFYCVGQTVHWDVLDTAEKKLKPMKSFDLGSPATSLRMANGKIVALTNRDSIEIIDYLADEGDESSGLIHVDPRARNAVHLMEIAGPQLDEPQSSLIMVCDRECGVGGLWVPWRAPGKDCEPVFEAELPASIRKFRRGRTRPCWEQGRHPPRYGRLAGTVDDAEILGICLDGSMQHFSFLNVEIWRTLRFIQNLALTSSELYPFTYETVDLVEFDPEPRLDAGPEMHVDGDMLRRCLEKRALERLIACSSHVSRFAELLDELEDGRLTADFGVEGHGLREKYFALAYDILEHFLSPVL